MTELGVFEAIHSLRSIRRFTPEPVADDDVRRILEAATKAPSPTNAQPWAFVVVRDEGRRKLLGEIYARAWELAKQFYGDPAKATSDEERRLLESTDALAARYAEVPVLIVACLDRARLGPLVTPDFATILDPASAYGSVWAAIENCLLAARALGLGSTPTTVHRIFEADVKELLALPSHVETVAMIAVGHPDQRFGAPLRRPLEASVHLERWDDQTRS